MTNIFISYRREDSDYATDRLYADLSAHFGAEQVFRDAQSIPGGADFTHAIEDALETAQVLVIVIGRNWLELLQARAQQPGTDWVRFEIETGLRRLQRGRLKIFPILVDGARFPGLSDLPESLRSLTPINAMPLRTGRDYQRDLDDLISSLIAAGVRRTPTPPLPQVEMSASYIQAHEAADTTLPVILPPDIPSNVQRSRRAQTGHTIRKVFSDWKFWVATFLAIMPIFLTLNPPQPPAPSPGPTPTPPPFAATLYYGQALTLHIPQSASLNTVRLMTNKNSSAPNHLADDFDPYFPGGIVNAVCLQYQMIGTASAITPRVCTGLETRQVMVNDPFWIDTAQNRMLPIQISMDSVRDSIICQPDGGPCSITQ